MSKINKKYHRVTKTVNYLKSNGKGLQLRGILSTSRIAQVTNINTVSELSTQIQSKSVQLSQELQATVDVFYFQSNGKSGRSITYRCY